MLKSLILSTGLILFSTTAYANQFAILAPHKDGVSAAIRDIQKKSNVTACSKKHSGRCVSGTVKNYNLGQKVLLPGGTWVDCAGDCRNKLRAKTVDFWYEQKLNN